MSQLLCKPECTFNVCCRSGDCWRRRPKDAKTLIDEVAKDPSLDLFFQRCPLLPKEERNVRLLKARAERASWGYRK